MKRRIYLSVFMFGFLGLFLFAAISYGADVIKVGIVDTYSGPAATCPRMCLDGFKMAVNKINAKGGVGKKD